ncbi:uncharacterized protein DNG_08944 [Cephalotrichum gorgonifer]|uniref:Uncharacterized protein n=1 Tax=Cephalotrichum gorgonifer TaxID=2041049 RepID=A0AAE8SYU2_9PEZI|nr:uncharacterized protein DNG_08944 [Cephalotrichum gorgonifer]
MVQRASSTIPPCLQHLMDSELRRWRTIWMRHLNAEPESRAENDAAIDRRLLHLDKSHLDSLMGLWEHSIRLIVASVLLRQALMASVGPSLRSSNSPPPYTGF